MKKTVVRTTVVVLYSLLMVLVSLMPGSGSEPWFPQDDKLMHMGAYAMFAVLCAPFWLRSNNIQRTTLMILALLWLFSGAMELGQTQVPNRDASWLDMLANTLGLALGWQISRHIKKARIWRAFVAD